MQADRPRGFSCFLADARFTVAMLLVWVGFPILFWVALCLIVMESAS